MTFDGAVVDSEVYALLPLTLQEETGITLQTTGANQYQLSWQNEINFTDLFGANNLLPGLQISNSTLLVTDEGASNSYEFTGDVLVGGTSFGLETSFTEENSELSWNEVTIEQLSLANLADELQGGFEAASDFLEELGTIDLNFTKDETGSIDFDIVSDIVDFTYSDNNNFAITVNDSINFTTLFNVDGFLPDLTISNATFTAASVGQSTNFDFNGQIEIAANQNFGFSSSFTQDTTGLDWSSLAIEDFDLGSLASEIPGLQQVNDYLGGLGTIDLNLSKDDAGAIIFTGAEDLADLENSDYSLAYAGSDDFSFTVNDGVDLTALFEIDSFLPSFNISSATFAATAEGFDLSGDIGIANQDPFTLTGSFSNETGGLTWQSLGVEGLNLGSLVSSIPGLGVVETWVGDAATVDFSIAKDDNGNNEYAIALPGEINLTSLFSLNSFLPKLTIGEATFTVGTENNSTVYGLSGVVGIGSIDYEIETQFSGDSSGNSLSWDSATIKQLDFGELVSEIGGGISKVDDIFGSIIPAFDLTLTSDEISFQGIEVDFASSNDKALKWISNELGLDTIALDFSYISSGDISISADLGGNINLISTNKFSANLNSLALDFSISGTDAEPSFKLDGNLSLFVDNQYLDLSGGIAFEPESITSYFLLDSEQAWVDPFGISDTEIRQLGFQFGASYLTAIDNVGFIGDLKFNDYDFKSAFLVDLNDPDNFALELTLNESISVATLITGGPAGLAISQLGQEGEALITNTTDFLDDYLDFNISSIDSDGDGELDPLIKIVPVATTIAGVTIEEGFGINGAIDIFGKEAIVALNGDLDSGQVQGSIEVDRIDFGIDGVYDDILVVEGSDNSDDKENGTLVGNSSVSNGVLSLDGSGDYVRIEGSSNFDSITEAITVETWIKVDNFNRTWQAIVTQGDNSWRLHRYKNTNYLNFAINGIGNITGSTNVNDGKWHRIAAVYDGNEMRLYVDGKLDASRSANGSIPISDYDVLIGENDQRRNRYFDGQIDDVRIWNTARSEAEINDNATLTGKEEGLVGYWNFDGNSVDGSTVKDLATRDNDKLNLDFELTPTGGSINGDGKIIFLGQELLDVNISSEYDFANPENSSLEFTYATDTGFISTDLTVAMSKSGFSADGGIDVDLSGIQVDLGALGKISLGDVFSANADASISLDLDNFTSSFTGNVIVAGKSISFSVSIDEPIPDLTTLYNKVKNGIINDIKNAATEIFQDIEDFALAVADGTVEFAGDVADVAVNVYGDSKEAAIAAYQTVGATTNDIANGLSSAYNLSSNATAQALKTANYTANEVAGAVKDAYNLTQNALTNTLKAAGYGANEVAGAVKDAYNLTQNALTNTLKAAGYGANEVAGAVKDAYNLTQNALTNTLKAAGYGANEVAGAIKGAYNLTSNATTQALKAAGYTTDQVAGAVKNAYNLSQNALASTLKTAGYTATQVGDALQNTFSNLSSDQIAQALDGANYGINEVGNYLKKNLDLGDKALARALDDIGYDADDVGNFFKKELDWGKNRSAKALKGAFSNKKVEKFFKDFWGGLSGIKNLF